MFVLMGAGGFLGRTVKEECSRQGRDDLVCLGRKEFNLLTDDPPKVPVKNGACLLYCADYYPGITATAEDPLGVWKRNLTMYEKMFAFAVRNGIAKIVTIGTTACYPVTDKPLREDMFFPQDLSRLNPKLLGYASSRMTLLTLAALWRKKYRGEHAHLILPNFYGPGDTFVPGKSHLLSSWIHDFWGAKDASLSPIVLWGSPDVRREFIYIDDAARSVIALAETAIHREVLNVGYGLAPTYEELARSILRDIGYDAPDRIVWDASKKTPRAQEVLDLTELSRYHDILPRPTGFAKGLAATIDYYKTEVLPWTQ